MALETFFHRNVDIPVKGLADVSHNPHFNTVHKNIGKKTGVKHIVATGGLDSELQLSSSQKTTLIPYFNAFESAAQVYSGSLADLNMGYGHSADNMKRAFDMGMDDDSKSEFIVDIISGGAFFQAMGITPKIAQRIRKLNFYSPVLGIDTIKPKAARKFIEWTKRAKIFHMETAEEHLARLRPLIETVSQNHGRQNVIFYTGDESDYLVIDEFVADIVNQEYGDLVTVRYAAYQGHTPPEDFLVNASIEQTLAY